MNDVKTILEKIKKMRGLKKDSALAKILEISEVELKNLKYRNTMSTKAVEIIVKYAKENFISLDLLFLNRNYELSLEQELENLEFDLYELEEEKRVAEKKFLELNEEERQENFEDLAMVIEEYEYEYERIIQEASTIQSQIDKIYQDYEDYEEYINYQEENRMIKYFKRKESNQPKIHIRFKKEEK